MTRVKISDEITRLRNQLSDEQDEHHIAKVKIEELEKRIEKLETDLCFYKAII